MEAVHHSIITRNQFEDYMLVVDKKVVAIINGVDAHRYAKARLKGMKVIKRCDIFKVGDIIE